MSREEHSLTLLEAKGIGSPESGKSSTRTGDENYQAEVMLKVTTNIHQFPIYAGDMAYSVSNMVPGEVQAAAHEGVQVRRG